MNKRRALLMLASGVLLLLSCSLLQTAASEVSEEAELAEAEEPLVAEEAPAVDAEPPEEEEPFAEEQFEDAEDSEQLEAPDFGDMESGCAIGPAGEECQDVEVADVGSPQGGVSGRLMQLSVTNPSTEEIIATIPCGLVFEPAVPGEQRMMVVQPELIQLAAGETATLQPYVMCIDSDLDAASVGAGYSVGTYASADLLKLAECVCQHDLDAEIDPATGGFGLQLAVWSVADGTPLAEVEAELEAMQAMMEQFMGEDGEGPEGMGGAEMESMMGLMSVSAEDVSMWYEECDLEPAQ